MKLEQSVVVLLQNLYKALRKRIEERRTAYSPLQIFFKNPNKDLDTTLIKSELKALILTCLLNWP